MKKYSIQKVELDGVLVKISYGVMYVANRLTNNIAMRRFQMFLKGHAQSFLKGERSFPHLWIK
jgi:hypothetical protein